MSLDFRWKEIRLPDENHISMGPISLVKAINFLFHEEITKDKPPKK